MKRIILFSIITFCVLFNSYGQKNYDTAKPWTYWWWMGSAVDKENIQKQLEDFHDASLGGVHIIPIYGVKGYEDQYKEFLSEEWMEMVEFTISEAKLNYWRCLFNSRKTSKMIRKLLGILLILSIHIEAQAQEENEVNRFVIDASNIVGKNTEFWKAAGSDYLFNEIDNNERGKLIN